MQHGNTNQKKSGLTMLILVKADFRTRKIIRSKMTLHNDKGVSSARLYNNSKFI